MKNGDPVTVDKPYSKASENNRDPILGVLLRAFANSQRVLEIGSGTGQHAVHMAAHLPNLFWQTSDLAENHPGICAWLAEYEGDNVGQPLELDVSVVEWSVAPVEMDAVFSANTAHIMSWPVAQQMISGVGKLLPAGGIFALYGPFNYGGEFTSDSNASFDVWLKEQNPERGIRDFEAVVECAMDAGMMLIEDNEMPANNRLLVFGKAG